MDAKLKAALSSSGERLNVAAVCRNAGISRQTFYKWRARYGAHGADGFIELSRRPRRSPQRLSPVIEDAIVEMRKRLLDEGKDAGAASIGWYLGRGGAQKPPSEATIWRALARRGFITPQPYKRPKRSYRRFEAPAPNETWQVDHTTWALSDGTEVQVLNIVDDYSRACMASVVAPSVTSGFLWATFSAAGGRWGLPARCLSDNGVVFSGRLRGFEVDFEARLREAGIKKSNARPFHPQTCGKVERFQQTLKKWLRARRKALVDLATLQAVLDEFAHFYNYHRPHRAIGRQVPYERWSGAERAGPLDHPLPAPGLCRSLRVDGYGVITMARKWRVYVGPKYGGQMANVLQQGHFTAIYVDGQLVRELDIDPTRVYQGSGKRARPRRQG